VVFAHDLAIGIERDVGHVLALEHAGDQLADASVAADDDVVDIVVGRVYCVPGLSFVFQVGAQSARQNSDQRCEHHRQDHDAERRVRDGLVQDADGTPETYGDEGEFAGLNSNSDNSAAVDRGTPNIRVAR
jgi:hypothetical protein